LLYKTRNPHGGRLKNDGILLDFSASVNPLGAPPCAIDAISAALPDISAYPDPMCRRLVEAIARYEGVRKDYILCGSGACELIYSFCEAARPGSCVVAVPTFSEYSRAAARSGSSVIPFLLKKDNGFELDFSFISFLEENRPDAVFICNPNNPTGRLVSPDVLASLLEFCRSSGAILFADECFIELSSGGVSMKDRLGEYKGLFILKALTKSHGLAGLRLGYCLCADGELLSAMSRAVQPWNISSLAQAAGAAALSEHGFPERAAIAVSAERGRLCRELEGCGLWVCPSEANFILFHGPDDLASALNEKGIAIRSCENFEGLSSGWYRAAIRLRDDNDRLISAIKQITGK